MLISGCLAKQKVVQYSDATFITIIFLSNILDKNWFETYQLILICGDRRENGLWEDIGSIFFLLDVRDGMVCTLGPDD